MFYSVRIKIQFDLNPVQRYIIFIKINFLLDLIILTSYLCIIIVSNMK